MRYFIFVVIIAIFLYLENSTLSVSRYTLKSSKLKQRTVIVQVSDFHNTHIKRLKEDLWKQIRDTDPDIICLTGDLVDSRFTDVKCALDYVNQLAQIAPIYFVTGNHEIRLKKKPAIIRKLYNAPMTVLEDEAVVLNGINLIGMDDFYDIPEDRRNHRFTDKYEQLHDDSLFNVVMLHRPELFETYCENNVDLIICGHCHGGQIRLPLLGPGFAPNQGLFPKFSEGIYQKDGTSLIVSRGIGNSLFPFRVNNHPELVIITLQPENDVEL